MASFRGARIGLFESRLSNELAELVRRLGGTPVVAPAVREVPHEEETARFLDALLTGHFRVIVFLTGAAAKAVLREADATGHLSDAGAAIQQATLVCRRPQPPAVARSRRRQHDSIPEIPVSKKQLLTTETA